MKIYESVATHSNITQNMHGASRNYRYVWDVSVRQLTRTRKWKHKEGRDSSHSYCSRTYGPRGTTHSTSGRRPWLWMVPGGGSSFRQGVGAASPGSPDLETAAAAIQRGVRESQIDIRGFHPEG